MPTLFILLIAGILSLLGLTSKDKLVRDTAKSCERGLTIQRAINRKEFEEQNVTAKMMSTYCWCLGRKAFDGYSEEQAQELIKLSDELRRRGVTEKDVLEYLPKNYKDKI